MLLTLRVLLRGQGIGWECATQLPGDQLDRVWLQIGGGAMASAQILALEAAVELGLLRALPAVMTVQTEACAPGAPLAPSLSHRLLVLLHLLQLPQLLPLQLLLRLNAAAYARPRIPADRRRPAQSAAPTTPSRRGR